MNYRHSFHAGNFADVLKHVVLVRVLNYFKQKPKPFRVIDTHAGIGLYDLRGDAAQKTNEWCDGIAKLLGTTFSPDVDQLLAPYLECVKRCNRDGGVQFYPGSPRIISDLLRPDDRLIVNELHQDDVKTLARQFSKHHNVKVLGHDGWAVLKAVLPPKERRGLTLVDPPFEQPGEFDRLVQCVRDHQTRFATGCQILWYPIKDERQVLQFYKELKSLDLKSYLQCKLSVDRITPDGPIRATGLAIINPPYVLHDELAVLLPALCATLRRSRFADFDLQRMTRA